MNFDDAVRAFGSLGHGVRLAVFRRLARAGADGVVAGELARALELSPSSLSFHLTDLVQAGLVQAQRRGRTVSYRIAEQGLSALLWFVGEDCCQGRLRLCSSPTARIDSLPARGTSRSVVFVCTQNSARSQMAEALLRAQAGADVEVCSAGLEPTKVHPLAKAALREADVPCADLRAKDLGSLLGKRRFTHAVVLCADAAVQFRDIAEFAPRRLHWLLPDPAAATGRREQRLGAFRAVRDELSRRIASFLAGPRRPTNRPPSV